MRILLYILLFVLLYSCKSDQSTNQIKKEEELSLCVKVPEVHQRGAINKILESNNVVGVVPFLDGCVFVNETDFNWVKDGHLPASTFKIPNTLIGLQSGAITKDHVFKYTGEERYLKKWEQDLSFKKAFQFSCLPCFQEMTRMVGYKKMKVFTDSLDYGALDVNEQNYDSFWLEGESRISPLEQIGFLERLKERRLPFDKKHMDTVIEFMQDGEQDGWKIFGKTGMSITDGKSNGWYVGWAEKDEETIYFAANLEPADHENLGTFISDRKKVVLESLRVIQ